MRNQSLSEESPSVLINSHTLKVEKENAHAMVDGFWKENKLYYVTIFTAHRRATSLRNDFRRTPKLLTTKNYPPRPEYPLSDIGKALQKRNYKHNTQYLAILDTIYHIENDIRLWDVLCTDGTFDIWHPEAPFNSLEGKTDPMILLLRIYQIDEDFSGELTDKYYSYVVEPREVRLLEPVLPNNEFKELKKKLNWSDHRTPDQGERRRITSEAHARFPLWSNRRSSRHCRARSPFFPKDLLPREDR